jgi:hypothetical protein
VRHRVAALHRPPSDTRRATNVLVNFGATRGRPRGRRGMPHRLVGGRAGTTWPGLVDLSFTRLVSRPFLVANRAGRTAERECVVTRSSRIVDAVEDGSALLR